MGKSDMALSLVMIVVGAGILLKGANLLVDGGVGIALKSGVSHLVVGLTIVAFGTSAPELTASIVAAMKGSGDICFGNVVGSNVANVALILGITALLLPVKVNRLLLRWELPFMVGISALTCFIGYTGHAGRFTGLILLSLFGWYIAHCMKSPAVEVDVDDEKALKSYPILITMVVIGVGGLVIGGKLFVDGAQTIAHQLGVSEAVIGLTVVALGTSLPELATSVVAAYKRQSDISIGNIIGSNIFNILFVLGATAILLPFSITTDRFLLLAGIPFMMGLAVLMWPFSATGAVISRIEGGIFFVIYISFTALAVLLR